VLVGDDPTDNVRLTLRRLSEILLVLSQLEDDSSVEYAPIHHLVPGVTYDLVGVLQTEDATITIGRAGERASRATAS